MINNQLIANQNGRKPHFITVNGLRKIFFWGAMTFLTYTWLETIFEAHLKRQSSSGMDRWDTMLVKRDWNSDDIRVASPFVNKQLICTRGLHAAFRVAECCAAISSISVYINGFVMARVCCPLTIFKYIQH
jgi:hypothetical protein